MLEGVVGCKHRIHMTREQDANGSIGPHAEMEMGPSLDCLDGAPAVDGLDGIRRKQSQIARQSGKGVCQIPCDLFQSSEVRRPAIDGSPTLNLRQHGRITAMGNGVVFISRQTGHATS